MSNTCVGCKFLFLQDSGYSNWTVLDTEVVCALEKNPNLPKDRPFDWNESQSDDNWDATRNSRCSSYEQGETFHLDCDGDVRRGMEKDLALGMCDEEQVRAILGYDD